MGEDIRSWLDGILEESRFQWEHWKKQKLDDADGWGGILTSSLQVSSDFSGSGILLTGGDSYGKQSVAVQIMGLLATKSFEGIFLDGMELGGSGIVLARKKLDCLLDHFYDRGTGLCLILEGLERCPCRRELLRFLGQKLCEYRMYRDQLTPLFMILMDDNEQDIPVLLRDRLRLCRLRLPDRERRAAYLAKYARSLRNYLSLDLFAGLTEGVSFVQLQDMIFLTECYVDSRDGQVLSKEELAMFLADQMPPATPEQTTQNFYRSIEQLVEQLPQRLQGGGVNYAASPIATTPVQVTQPQVPVPAATPTTREDVEKLPPLVLANELFGEEAVSDMRRMAQIMQ